MTMIIPQLAARGAWSLVAPWSAVPTKVYECISIRTFTSLLQDGIDPVEAFYAPVGLGATEYQADVAAGAVIVTLSADTSAPIHVPSTHISNYPQQDVVPYSNICGSFLIGPLPDSVDLTALVNSVAGIVEDTMGVTPTVTLHRLASTDVVTQSDSTTMETARQAAITNRTTDRARRIAAEQALASLQEKYNALVAYLKAHP